ncbi:MAG TPA: hypothetical protein VF320_10485 [Acidimicrobiales bacterium]
MATDVSADLVLSPLGREPRTVAEWTTMFHLAVVVLDPYTYESSWILDTATRVLRDYAAADCRVAFLVTADEADTRQFLGPLAQEFLAFTDPDRTAVAAFGLETLPAFVHLNQHHAVEADAQGWDPDEWRAVADNLSVRMSWGRPVIPAVGDPLPFVGSPAAG